MRRQQRDEAGAAVGQANQAIARIDLQIESIQSERQRLRQQAQGQRVGSISVDSLMAGGRYDLQLQNDSLALNQTRGELEQELQRRQLALTQAETEVKRFEQLEEKERAAYWAEELRREQAEADEATSRRYTIARKR